MHDEIAHLRIVDRLLRLGAPRDKRACVVGEDADDVQAGKVLELHALKALQLSAEHEVQQLFLSVFFGHRFYPWHPW